VQPPVRTDQLLSANTPKTPPWLVGGRLIWGALISRSSTGSNWKRKASRLFLSLHCWPRALLPFPRTCCFLSTSPRCWADLQRHPRDEIRLFSTQAIRLIRPFVGHQSVRQDGRISVRAIGLSCQDRALVAMAMPLRRALTDHLVQARASSMGEQPFAAQSHQG